jgi:glycosyltransferase involved in cell wall biosynthesis
VTQQKIDLVERTAPEVTVVIPSYGRTALLRKALLSLAQQDVEKQRFEVIVVDSSPDNQNAAMLEELVLEFPTVLRWFVKEPEGPGPSRNLGAREGRGGVIAFMDSDCEASPGWLRAGLAAFRDGIGIVQGKTQAEPGVRRGIFSHCVVVESESPLYETANIFYSRSAFEQSGGFPADLTPTASTPMGGEDTQLAWTVIRHGWKTCFCPEALMYHAVLATGPWHWLFTRQLYCLPNLTHGFPELRRYLYASYFLNIGQALFVVAVAGILLGIFQPWGFLLTGPYAVYRTSQANTSMKGVLRLLRVPPYFVRDAFSFLILTAASLRYRSLVL